jgi:hypothetical protein
MHVGPADLVVHADAHSLTFFRHYRPDPGRHVLLLPTPHLAYYEGDLVTADSLRWSPDRLQAALEAGGTIWGLHMRYRYAPADTAAHDLEANAVDTVYAEPPVRIWRLGRP